MSAQPWSFANAPGGPFRKAGGVTPSDTDDLPYETGAVFVGGAGSLVAVIGGTEVSFAAVPAGTVLPILCTRIKSTGTTATSIVWMA